LIVPTSTANVECVVQNPLAGSKLAPGELPLEHPAAALRDQVWSRLFCIRSLLKSGADKFLETCLQRAHVISLLFQDVSAHQRAAAGLAVSVNDLVLGKALQKLRQLSFELQLAL